MKVGDRAKIKSSTDDQIVIITRVFWRGTAGSCVSYIDSVEIMYENGMKSMVPPKSIEIIKEVD